MLSGFRVWGLAGSSKKYAGLLAAHDVGGCFPDVLHGRGIFQIDLRDGCGAHSCCVSSFGVLFGVDTLWLFSSSGIDILKSLYERVASCS